MEAPPPLHTFDAAVITLLPPVAPSAATVTV